MEIESQMQEIIRDYDTVIKLVHRNARDSEDRAYGGYVRMTKGALVEHTIERLVQITWQSIGGHPDLLEINSKKIHIPIQPEYINRIKEPEVQQYLRNNIVNYFYKLSVDKHVCINGEFVIGIECKAYAENAMIKRILIDFDLLKKLHPNLSCYLFQLESQLGGDYSKLEKPVYGSPSTHTIQSYFSYDLNIVTLLSGERKIAQPIHTHFKPLTIAALENAVAILATDMTRFL